MVSLTFRPSGADAVIEGDESLESVLVCDLCGQPIQDYRASVVFDSSGSRVSPVEFDIVHKACDDDRFPSSIDLVELVQQLARRHLTRGQLLKVAEEFINP